MDVLVEGWRSSPANWREAHRIPVDKVPSLTEAQKEVARKMQIAEEDYARSALAGELTQAALLEKARKFAALLDQRVQAIRKDAAIESVRLQTTEHRFAVLLNIDTANGHRSMPLRISEELVDDLLESSSEDAVKQLDRMLQQAFALETV